MSNPIGSFGSAWGTLLARSGLRSGGLRSLVLHLMVIAGFGILVPWRRGLDFFDPILFFAYSAIGLLMAASAVTDLLAAPDARPGYWPAVFASALHGWTLLAFIYALGIGAVNLAFRAPRLLHPNWKLLGAALLFALAGSLFLAAFGAVLSLLFSPSVSRTSIRLLFLFALLGAVFAFPRLPLSLRQSVERQLTTAGLIDVGLIGTAVFTVLFAGLLYALRRPRY